MRAVVTTGKVDQLTMLQQIMEDQEMSKRDILDSLDTYDRLKLEFEKYKRKVGTIKKHSAQYLQAALLEVMVKIRELENAEDDEYRSYAAALNLWRYYRRCIEAVYRRKLRSVE
jgi:hypothetical protein